MLNRKLEYKANFYEGEKKRVREEEANKLLQYFIQGVGRCVKIEVAGLFSHDQV